MQNKRLISIIFLITFLFSNIGWSISVHYCQGEAYYGKLNYSIQQFEDSCDNKITTKNDDCCVDTFEISEEGQKSDHEQCCKDDVIKVSTSDQTIQKTYSQIFEFVIPDYSWTDLTTPVADYSLPILEALHYYIDSNAPPLYKLYCRLIFYA